MEDWQLYELAWLRFQQKKSNQEAAAALDVDAPAASRGLQQAYDSGIVQLCPPTSRLLGDLLGDRMSRVKGNIFVAECEGYERASAVSPEEERGVERTRTGKRTDRSSDAQQLPDHYRDLARKAVGSLAAVRLKAAAARAWARNDNKGSFAVGLSGGRTVLETLVHLRHGELEPHGPTGRPLEGKTSVVALAAAGHIGQISESANFAVAYLNLLNRQIETCGCPYGSAESDHVEAEKLFGQAFDMVITGIGDAKDEDSVFCRDTQGGQQSQFQDEVKKLDPAGEMFYHPFDDSGCPLRLCERPYEAIPLLRVKELVASGTQVMLVAAGRGLARAIVAANKAELFQTLICDDSLARELLLPSIQ